MDKKTSRIPDFYKLSPEKRMEIVKSFSDLENKEINRIRKTGGLNLNLANQMVENVIGVMEIPLGIATNFLINGKDYLIPMATEEPSVIAAASNGAKMARTKGGFTARIKESLMIGQIQVVCKNIEKAKSSILKNKKEIFKIANKTDPLLLELGGGAKDIEIRIIETSFGKMIILHLLVDPGDAMGANIINTMCERVAPLIEKLTSGKVYLRIVSNLAIKRLVRARGIFPKKILGGADIVDRILIAHSFALADSFRATTHNKGIMNGIAAVALATGNDTRAIEAAAHSFASISGRYKPLTDYKKNKEGDLIGKIEIPLPVGIVGGATKVNPISKVCLKILKVKKANELAEVMASVGLAQNLAALNALVKEGIQKGHMRLHAKNIAISAGATGKMINKTSSILIKEGNITLDRAKAILKKIKNEDRNK